MKPASYRRQSSDATAKKIASSSGALLEALEARVLFSGAPVDAPETEEAAPADTETVAAVATTQEGQAAGQTGSDETTAAVSGDTPVTLASSGGLNAETLQAVADAAKQQWIDSGLSADQIAALDSVNYSIADLGGNSLGVVSGNAITIDDDAAGRGWFVDGESDGTLTDSGRFDLLTLVLHEQGHILGLDDQVSGTSNVMSGILNPGDRRTVEAGQAAGATPLSLEGRHEALTTAAIAGTTLSIIGDGADDALILRINAGNFEYDLNGGGFTVIGAVAGVDNIVIDMGAGVDTVNFQAMTVAADVSVSATSFDLDGALDISGAATPTMTIDADRVLIDFALNTGAGGVVNFTPDMTGNVIDYFLGSASNDFPQITGGSVGLSNLELSRITTGTLNIGDSDSGEVRVSSDIVLPANTVITTSASTLINVNFAVDGAYSLTINHGNTTNLRVDSVPGSIGQITPLTSLTTNAGGTTFVQDAGLITTTGAQTYNDTFHVGIGATATTRVANANLTASSVNFSGTTVYGVHINGAAGAGVTGGHDELTVNGGLNLGNADLSLQLNGFVPMVGDSYIIIQNDGGDAISGTFLQGSAVTVVSGNTAMYFDIDYAAGDGNDVELTRVASPSVIYVEESWAGSVLNTVLDGDRELAGTQTAFFGANAFASVADALAMFPGFAGDFIVNAGDYGTDIDLTGAAGDITLQFVEDQTEGETQVIAANLLGDALDAIDTSRHGVTGIDLVVEGGSFAGVISNLGGVTLDDGNATNTLILSGANTYSGNTTVVDGELQVNNAAGSGTGTGAVTVEDGGNLTGTGSIAGTLTVESGGTVSPGVASLESFPVGDLTLDTGSTYEAELDALPGNDALVVTGTVTINSADLAMSTFTTMPTVGQSFTIIDNDGNDAVVGTFNGLAQGNFIAVDNGMGQAGTIFRIAYNGGTGNDVVLTAIAVASTSVAIDASGNLVICDVDPVSNDNIFIETVGGDLIIRDPNNALGTLVGGAIQTSLGEIRVGLGLFTGDVIVKTLGGNDTIRVGNLAGLPGGLVVDGGDGFDTLSVGGTVGATVVLGVDGDADLSADVVRVNRSTITASGNGSITIEGEGNGTGNFIGTEIVDSSLITTAGNITLTGEGGTTGGYNKGVNLSNATISSTGGGSLAITGTGGGTTGSNFGVHVNTGVALSTVGAGTLTITGQGGAGIHSNDGVYFSPTSTASVVDGNMTVTGTGGGTGDSNEGITLEGSTLTSTGTGNIYLVGFGSAIGAATANSNSGVSVSSSSVSATASGSVSVTGSGSNTSGGNNEGVKVANGPGISTNTGSITLTGTGGGIGKFNRGVWLLSTTVASSGSGNVNITGQGTTNAAATGGSNQGIAIQSSGVSTGGAITLLGTGGRGVGQNHGIFLSTGNVSAGGALTVTGAANALATGQLNVGVYAQNSSVLNGGGGSAITGTGGGGTKAHGLFFQASTSSTVPLASITGTAGGGAGSLAETGGFTY